MFSGEDVLFSDSIEVEDKRAYLEKITEKDTLVIIGGDGTLNKFVNSIDDKEYPFPIYCYAGGTGNDFIKDVAGDSESFVKINEYIKSLPSVTVNGKSYRFINGVGFGLDGYCCAESDAHRARTGKSPSYIKIAIKGLLGGYKRVKAKVSVDGEMLEYDNVWLAPTMNGRYYGGGVMITPTQDRLNPERNISFAIAHSKSGLKIATVLPTAFRGNHLKYEKIFRIVQGKHIKVEFDRPTALQIDGETFLDVTSYEAKSSLFESECEKKEAAECLSR